MTSQEADAKILEITQEYAEALTEYCQLNYREGRELLYPNGDWLDDTERVRLAVFLEHKNWAWAANLCSDRLDDWDSEVYYLRQCGLMGRVTIAQRSVERVYNWLKEKRCGPSNYHVSRYDF